MVSTMTKRARRCIIARMDDDYLREIFDGLGHVSIRKLFGGKGIYHNGLIVGIALRGEVMLKGDEHSAPEFEAAGAERWSYQGKRRPVQMPYWKLPAAILDEPDELAEWTRKAYEAALRTEGKG